MFLKLQKKLLLLIVHSSLFRYGLSKLTHEQLVEVNRKILALSK